MKPPSGLEHQSVLRQNGVRDRRNAQSRGLRVNDYRKLVLIGPGAIIVRCQDRLLCPAVGVAMAASSSSGRCRSKSGRSLFCSPKGTGRRLGYSLPGRRQSRSCRGYRACFFPGSNHSRFSQSFRWFMPDQAFVLIISYIRDYVFQGPKEAGLA